MNTIAQFATTPNDIDATPCDDGKSFITQGRLSPCDGGHDHYIYRHNRPANLKLDGGFFIECGKGYLESVDKTVVNVRRFGANGIRTTNQTRELQTAIDVAILRNLDVYFPPGRYLFDRLLAGAPSRWIGGGKERTIFYASGNSAGALIEDSGNGSKFTMEGVRIQGSPEAANVSSVIRLGHNQYPWGSGGRLDNVVIHDFPNAVGVDVNQNISKVDNCWIQNCLTGIKARGNGLNLSHVQVTASRGIALDLLSPSRIYDLEIEAPFVSPVMRISRQSHVFGLHISLSPKTVTGNLETLIEWEQAAGQLIGTRLDLAGTGDAKATYTNFMTGARTLAKPFDVFFDPTAA